jgi:hypothetical protein
MNMFKCFKMELKTVGKDSESDDESEGKIDKWFIQLT